MDGNCGEWLECMDVASGCGEQEAGVASGSGWNLWVWLLGVVVRRYIDFLILLIHTYQPSRVSLDYPGIWGLIQGSRDSYNNPGILS